MAQSVDTKDRRKAPGYTLWRSSRLARNVTGMKTILYFTGIVTLLSTSGCFFPEGDRGGREHGRYERHDSVMVGPPPVVVRAPELVVRPPEVIVR